MNHPPVYYFLGIGGIGMSAIARHFNESGFRVAGYDKTPSDLTAQLEAEGIEISFLDDFESVPADFKDISSCSVVYTPAIPADNQILNGFRSAGFALKKRSVMLGEISRDTFNIAVAGTHGKTTTSCLVSHLLHTAQIPFSAFLGGVSSDLGSNYFNSGVRVDGVKITVTEADEFDRSFLTLNPDISIITSTDADHLDIYGKESEVKKSFADFAGKLKPGGALFHAAGADVALPDYGGHFSYGINRGDYSAREVRFEKGQFIFNLHLPNAQYKNMVLSIPGWHNVENAVAAAAVAHYLGADESSIRLALRTFKGVKRRFEFVKNDDDGIFIDDYAHHPTELSAIISSVKKMYPDKKITGIFQPHLYSRTRDFADGFAESLSMLDRVILMPIYPARELPTQGVNSEMILNRMNHPNAGICSRESLTEVLSQQPVEVLVTLGAGDIDREIKRLKVWMDGRNQ